MPRNHKRPRLEDSGSPERRSPQVSNRETPSHSSHLRDTPHQGSHTAVSPTAATEVWSRGVPGFSTDALSRPLLRLHSGCPIIGPELVYGDNLGSETRKMEFKRGRGDYLKTCFLRDVRRYTCAFLNSEGGSLLVGVDNDGTICGVVISHIWEDHARQQVDSCLKMFKPPVFPHQYSLIFLPVVRPGQDGRRLRVVCLTLQSPVANTEPILYQTDIEDIYIRRDGSVEGPLSVTTAMEWLSQDIARPQNSRITGTHSQTQILVLFFLVSAA
ncbi:schlafen-like protein 1 [Myripristis murdjan]|uniref:schlafen-like protein 1 n=1 Tax=Myripristis murdjan TaxID=586833 RepID=UPI00117617A7|nr:schlafen-like protein 1 [Myripristis murdjan]